MELVVFLSFAFLVLCILVLLSFIIFVSKKNVKKLRNDNIEENEENFESYWITYRKNGNNEVTRSLVSSLSSTSFDTRTGFSFWDERGYGIIHSSNNPPEIGNVKNYIGDCGCSPVGEKVGVISQDVGFAKLLLNEQCNEKCGSLGSPREPIEVVNIEESSVFLSSIHDSDDAGEEEEYQEFTCKYKCKCGERFVEDIREAPESYRALESEICWECREHKKKPYKVGINLLPTETVGDAFKILLPYANAGCTSLFFNDLRGYFWKSEMKRNEWKHTIGYDKDTKKICVVDPATFGCKYGNANRF